MSPRLRRVLGTAGKDDRNLVVPNLEQLVENEGNTLLRPEGLAHHTPSRVGDGGVEVNRRSRSLATSGEGAEARALV